MEKENISGNSTPSKSLESPSQGGTQGLHLELEDQDTEKVIDTQFSTQDSVVPDNLPEIGNSPSAEERPDKRNATEKLSDTEDSIPRKLSKIVNESIVLEEEEDMFSDVEVVTEEEKRKSIEVVTLGDSISESPETFSDSKEDSLVKQEPLSETVTEDSPPDPPETQDISSTKESSSSEEINKDSPKIAQSLQIARPGDLDREDSLKIIDLGEAAQTSTPDRSSQIESSNKQNSAPSQVEVSSSSSSNSAKNYHEEETLKIVNSSDEKEDDDSHFKTPEEDSGFVVALMKPSEFKKIANLSKVEDHFYVTRSIPNLHEKFRQLLPIFKKGDMMRRLSDLSGLSGGSSGYHGDMSSVGSSSNASSNRDRLSIMPETRIEPHKVLSPLPKRLWPQKHQPKEDDEPQEKLKLPKKAEKLKNDVKVFAKWVERTDIKFWPGIIKEDQEDKSLILFDDGYEKMVKKEDIVRADALLPGCQVNVEKEEGVHQVGVLLAYPDCSGGHVFYSVQLESLPNLPETEAESVSYDKVHLNLEQWKKMQNELGLNSRKIKSDVSLDNLQTGKRKSKPITPVKSTRKRNTKKSGENIETSAQDDDSEIEPKKKSNDSTSEDDSTKKYRRGRLPRKALFKNFVFLLTQGTKALEDDALEHGESAMETETEDDEEDKLEEVKFDRKLLKQKILDNGGKVLEKFPGEKEKIPENVIVVSDRVCRTMTYLLSIAYGFERVNFMWIHNCITAKEILNRQNYALQIGFSKFLHRDIENLEAIKEGKNRRELFKGLHMLIASTRKDFGEDWKPLLTRLGASVSVRTKGKLDRSLKAVSVVIADSNPPSTIVKDAQDKNLFPVSTEWIVQCLINGQRLPTGDYVL